MTDRMTLEQRIQRARGAIGYADLCAKEARHMPPAVRAVIERDIAEVRASADAVLRALLAEFEGVKQ